MTISGYDFTKELVYAGARDSHVKAQLAYLTMTPAKKRYFDAVRELGYDRKSINYVIHNREWLEI